MRAGGQNCRVGVDDVTVDELCLEVRVRLVADDCRSEFTALVCDLDVPGRGGVEEILRVCRVICPDLHGGVDRKALLVRRKGDISVMRRSPSIASAGIS
ncbi:hypothetical protein [Methanogenium cariaci]|uniref:hypothetical protein n=1 Tax=Methanogenium cariaci TaxID=2197 RepID=UPI001FDF80D4|nr:hypothetical protein [Methanogenium cariaci]